MFDKELDLMEKLALMAVLLAELWRPISDGKVWWTFYLQIVLSCH